MAAETCAKLILELNAMNAMGVFWERKCNMSVTDFTFMLDTMDVLSSFPVL